MSKKEVTIQVDQKMVVALVLAVLVLVAGVQAFQLNGLKTKLSDGDLSLNTGSSRVSTHLKVVVEVHNYLQIFRTYQPWLADVKEKK